MTVKYRTKILYIIVTTLLVVLLMGCSLFTNTKNNTNNSEITDNSNLTTPSPTTQNSVTNYVNSVEEKILFNLEKLKDQSYTDIYGDGYTWYIAAEELGQIGKLAIPGLIQKLDTKDDYERSLVLYALLLATQHDSVKSFTNGEYIDVNLDFNAENHPYMVKKAKTWWEKYKGNFK